MHFGERWGRLRASRFSLGSNDIDGLVILVSGNGSFAAFGPEDVRCSSRCFNTSSFEPGSTPDFDTMYVLTEG